MGIDLPTSIQLLKGKSSDDDKSCEASSSQEEGSCTASEEGYESEEQHASIVMPSSDVVEISQTFYWPLYAKPIDWIYQTRSSSIDNETLEPRAQRAAEELQSMAFFQKSNTDDDDVEND